MINKKDKLEQEINKVIEHAKVKGTITIEEVSERFAKLNTEEIDEILQKISEAGI